MNESSDGSAHQLAILNDPSRVFPPGLKRPPLRVGDPTLHSCFHLLSVLRHLTCVIPPCSENQRERRVDEMCSRHLHPGGGGNGRLFLRECSRLQLNVFPSFSFTLRRLDMSITRVTLGLTISIYYRLIRTDIHVYRLYNHNCNLLLLLLPLLATKPCPLILGRARHTFLRLTSAAAARRRLRVHR